MRVILPGDPAPLSAPVALAPAQTRHVAPDSVLQRLRYSQGRTLTQSAMAVEQAWAEARLGLWGRRLSSGVVDGLRVSVPDQAGEPGLFVLGGGRAIAPGGQDVVIHKSQRLLVDDLIPLGAVAEAAGDARGLIVVVLEPVVIEAENLLSDSSTLGAFEDPCPPDPAIGPYLDIVLQDAVRASWTALDATIDGADPALAPNLAAEALRTLEAADPDLLPWTGFGVPVVMMMVEPDGRIAWHHHAAVVRRGGVLPNASLTVLDPIRQSRIEGLVEETALATRNDGWDGSDGRRFLRHVPPAGMLPRKAWNSRDFFPAAWGEAQAPIPESQLDAAFEAARALAPYDIEAAQDRVKWLIPVPDHLYAPDLLEPLVIPDFNGVRLLLMSGVANSLALRDAYRRQATAVQGAIDLAAVTDFSNVDDDPIMGEDGFVTDDPMMPTDFEGEARSALTAARDLLSETLFTEAQRALLTPPATSAPTPPFGMTPFVTEMRAVIDSSNDTVDFSFNRVQTEIYRVRQIMLDEEEATKLATFPVLAGLAKGSSNFALSEGLRAQFQALNTPKAADATGGIAGTGGIDGGGGVILADAGSTRAARISFPDSTLAGTVTFDQTIATSLQGSSFLTGTGFVADSAVGGVDIVSQPQSSIGSTFTGFGSRDATLSFGTILNDSKTLSGASETAIKTLVDQTRGGLVDDALLLDNEAKKTGILRAAPVPGDIREIRSTTIADRLKASGALTAKASALRIKADVLRTIQTLGIALGDLHAPLTSAKDVVLLLEDDVNQAVAVSNLTAVEQDQFEGLRQEVADTGDGRVWNLVSLTPSEDTSTDDLVSVSGLTRLGTELRRRHAPIDMTLLPALALAKLLDPDPAATPGDPIGADDEAAFLQSAIATLESVVAILRVVEARIIAITTVVDNVAAGITIVDNIQRRWESALVLADQDLDEARHDLRVALSLIAEETERLTTRQAERERIIAEEVSFVAYTRPRALTAHRAGDMLGLLLPGAFDDPLPASLARDVRLPAALQFMIRALREMPIGWFEANPELAEAFSEPEYLGLIYSQASIRAATKQAQFGIASAISAPSTQGVATSLETNAAPVVQAMNAILTGYQALTQTMLLARAAIDYSLYDQASLAERKRQALADLSLNDLAEAGSHASVAKLALDEIGQIERVLHAELQLLRQVPAPIRFIWAQNLSIFDDALSLRSLVALPSFDQIDFELRNKLIRLNDWLFGRMESGIKEAEAIMSDIVRVAFLLAAHAPVAEIVSARIATPQTASKGGAIELVIRRGQPEIGMQVAVMEGVGVRGRGIVRDISGSLAKVELIEIDQGLATITPAFDVTIFRPAGIAFTGG